MVSLELNDGDRDPEHVYLYWLYEHAMQPCGNDPGMQQAYIRLLEELVDIARRDVGDPELDEEYRAANRRIIDRWPDDMKRIARLRCSLLIAQRGLVAARAEVRELMEKYGI